MRQMIKSTKIRRKIRSMQRFFQSRLYKCVGVTAWVIFAYVSMLSYIPDDIYLSKGNEQQADFAKALPVTVVVGEQVQPVFGTQNVNGIGEETELLECRLFDLIPVKQVLVHYTDREQVLAAGTNIGIYLKNEGVLVVECGSFTDQKGALISPSAYRIKSGDIIRSVNGNAISSKEELIDVINESDDDRLVLQIRRGTQDIDLAVTPELAADGKKKLGIWVRDDIAGIGTLTYITSDNDYGALGHAVSDIDSGELIRIDTGEIYETMITGISKGKRGEPGEVTGMIQFRPSAYLGSVGENTNIGIYGRLEQIPSDLDSVEPVEIGYKQEIEKGPATLICSVGGERTSYAIEIDSIDYHPKEANKGIRYHVTDANLLAQTGGIVQGMSGSPIIQKGRLIGAVTHVFVDDPTKGYGIFIENMLEHH